MQITKQADYALRAVLHLAQLGLGHRVSTLQIAREESIPATFLAKIISQLAAAGVVRAMRGAHGGITLIRPPESVSLLEIIEIIDGPLTLQHCLSDSYSCSKSSVCPLRAVLCEAQDRMITHLAQTNFSQMVQRAAFLELAQREGSDKAPVVFVN